jgi:Transmembrane amino acid transporter protein
VNGHVAVKYLYVRLFRDGGGNDAGKGNLMYQTTFKARGSWVAINAVLWVVAWIIAEGVPVFNDLLGLTSALFASWFTFGLSGLFWFKMNEGRWLDGWRKMVGSAVAGLCVLIGLLVVSSCYSFSFLLSPIFPPSSSTLLLFCNTTSLPRTRLRAHRWPRPMDEEPP